MAEQTYLQIARAFRAKREDAAAGPLSGEATGAGEAPVEGGEPSRAATARPVGVGATPQRAECASAARRGDEEGVRTLLDEMRPYLTRSLQRISDDGLLLLAKWNLHVAAERTIDARLTRRPEPSDHTSGERSAKKAN